MKKTRQKDGEESEREDNRKLDNEEIGQRKHE